MNSCISHQLLILGNGFDITCGLNSRFVQFFRPRMVVIDKNKNMRLAVCLPLAKAKVNLWKCLRL